MAQDDDFIIGGRKTRKSGSQGSPRTSTSKGGGSQSVIKLGAFPNSNMSFTKRLAKDMAIASAPLAVRVLPNPPSPAQAASTQEAEAVLL